MKNLRKLLISVGLMIGGLALWWLVSIWVDNHLLLPMPTAVFAAAQRADRLPENALTTFFRVVSGWLLGVVGGASAGLYLSSRPRFLRIVSPFIEFLRPIPPVALIPFFILWFGIGSSGQIGIISIAAFMVIFISTLTAVENVPGAYTTAARSFGASPVRIQFDVVLHSIQPDLVSALRVSAALSFGIGVAAEFMGAQSGLGYMVMVAKRTLHTDVIALATVFVAFESWLLDQWIRLIMGLLTAWAPRQVEGRSYVPELEAHT